MRNEISGFEPTTLKFNLNFHNSNFLLQFLILYSLRLFSINTILAKQQNKFTHFSCLSFHFPHIYQSLGQNSNFIFSREIHVHSKSKDFDGDRIKVAGFNLASSFHKSFY